MKMRVCIITFGCKVNQYESNQIAKQYQDKGFDVVHRFVPDADEYVVNTCAVTAMAEKKSRNATSRVMKVADGKPVHICGCGNDRSLNKSLQCWATQPRKRAFIKCQDGCNNFCTYCVIPHLRGRSTSRDASDIVAEIKACGKPVVLTGIDLSSYGKDNGSSLLELCVQVDKCGNKFELSSIEVGVITTELLQALTKCENFIPKFHVPLQSGSDKVLRDMNRKYTSAEYLGAITKIKKYFPNAELSTDVIRGFPTETAQDYELTLQLVESIGFCHVHYFPYSDRTALISSLQTANKPI